jgi:hypothetical protein
MRFNECKVSWTVNIVFASLTSPPITGGLVCAKILANELVAKNGTSWLLRFRAFWREHSISVGSKAPVDPKDMPWRTCEVANWTMRRRIEKKKTGREFSFPR